MTSHVFWFVGTTATHTLSSNRSNAAERHNAPFHSPTSAKHVPVRVQETNDGDPCHQDIVAPCKWPCLPKGSQEHYTAGPSNSPLRVYQNAAGGERGATKTYTVATKQGRVRQRRTLWLPSRAECDKDVHCGYQAGQSLDEKWESKEDFHRW
jgi:hypothetical protein